jgi:flagellar biosynthesis/type III secretory pathway protein FliH
MVAQGLATHAAHKERRMTSPILPSVTWSAEARRLPGRPVSHAKPKVAVVAPLASVTAASTQMTANSSPTEADRAQAQHAIDLAHEAARKAGHEAGHAEGFAQGQAEAKAKWQAEIQRLAALSDALGKRIDDTIQGWQAPVVEVTLSACRKILGDAALSGEAARAVVVQALHTLRKETLIQVRINPSDMAFLRETVLAEGGQAIAWQEDASVGRGGCLVVFAGGTLDARIETQMRAIAQALAGGVARHD